VLPSAGFSTGWDGVGNVELGYKGRGVLWVLTGRSSGSGMEGVYRLSSGIDCFVSR